MKPVFIQADAKHLPFADGAFDLTFGSPPYCDARTYGIDAQRGCVAWVEWMLQVLTELQRVTRGPVVINAAGVTRDRNYWPACEGLMWEWWKRGGECQLYRPCFWHRVGIPGSGGKDWFRADVEYVMCFKRPGRLPWSDNTAMGHPPKWAPGGEMSHRLSNGERVARDAWGGSGGIGRGRNVEGRHKKRHAKSNARGESVEQIYTPPILANPGNLVHIKVGGGLLGNKLAHENEAPFPEALAEWFIRSLCPPGGRVLDPFSGSGTTACVAHRLGREGFGTDLRISQLELSRRRFASSDYMPSIFDAPRQDVSSAAGLAAEVA